MISVKLDVDVLKVDRLLGVLGKQGPFAIAAALNRTGEEANVALRAHVSKALIIRDPRLLNAIAPRTLSRANRADKHKLIAKLETRGRGRILNPLETGEPHTTDRFGRQVAIPSTGMMGLRANPRTVIDRKLYPTNLGLAPRMDPKGTLYYATGKGALKRGLKGGPGLRLAMNKQTRTALLVGKRNTYQIGGVIYQRIGKGISRPLWYLRDSVPRPANLGFQATVIRTVNERWETNMDGQLAAALRDAR